MLDEIVELLFDSKPHSLVEIVAYIRCHHRVPIPSEQKVILCLEFLANFNFVGQIKTDVGINYFLFSHVANFWKTMKEIESDLAHGKKKEVKL